MRAFKKGEPFMDVPSENHVPDDDAIAEMRDDIKTARADRWKINTFSETYLYPRLGKDDARFVLAVAEEYERVIKKLGPDKVRELLS